MEAEPENSVEFIAGDNACVTDETPSKLSLSSESEVRSDEEAEQTLSLSTSGLDESVESPSKKARSELSTPTNLTAHHGRSRPTNCTDIPEFVRSFEEASELIRKYERDTATKHTIFQTNGMADFMSNGRFSKVNDIMSKVFKQRLRKTHIDFSHIHSAFKDSKFISSNSNLQS